MIIDFRKYADRLFTAVFFMIRAAQFSGKRFILNYGGAASSKSVSQHQSELINLITCEYDILFMRKVAADIYDSSYKLFESLAYKFGIYDMFEWTYSQGKRQILNKKTGHRIVFRGADDIGKLKSIVGIGRIVMEEADQFEYDDFKEINRRARGFPNIQIVFILNPVDEEHWLKRLFYDEYNPQEKWEDIIVGTYHERTHFIHTTWRDNKFLTKEDIDELMIMKEVDEYDYEVYAEGKWGRIRTGSEFYPHFKTTNHVMPTPFLPDLPMHVTYDFNVVPYMTELCFQINETESEIQLRFFQEYCLESPLNSVVSVCEALIDDFEKFLSDIFYYGDASGNRRIAGKGDEVNYDDVRIMLARWIDESSDRACTHNRPVLKRRKLINTILAGKQFYGSKKLVLMIDPQCKKLIEDMKKLKLGKNGKHKEEATNKAGIKYEKYGHTTDALEYAVCELYEELM